MCLRVSGYVSKRECVCEESWCGCEWEVSIGVCECGGASSLRVQKPQIPWGWQYTQLGAPPPREPSLQPQVLISKEGFGTLPKVISGPHPPPPQLGTVPHRPPPVLVSVPPCLPLPFTHFSPLQQNLCLLHGNPRPGGAAGQLHLHH